MGVGGQVRESSFEFATGKPVRCHLKFKLVRSDFPTTQHFGPSLYALACAGKLRFLMQYQVKFPTVFMPGHSDIGNYKEGFTPKQIQ